jgi:hypothetical protein
VHWVATKHVLRYLRGTTRFGLRYVGGDGVRMHRYSDSGWKAVQLIGRALLVVVSAWDP